MDWRIDRDICVLEYAGQKWKMIPVPEANLPLRFVWLEHFKNTEMHTAI